MEKKKEETITTIFDSLRSWLTTIGLTSSDQDFFDNSEEVRDKLNELENEMKKGE